MSEYSDGLDKHISKDWDDFFDKTEEVVEDFDWDSWLNKEKRKDKIIKMYPGLFEKKTDGQYDWYEKIKKNE